MSVSGLYAPSGRGSVLDRTQEVAPKRLRWLPPAAPSEPVEDGVPAIRDFEVLSKVGFLRPESETLSAARAPLLSLS